MASPAAIRRRARRVSRLRPRPAVRAAAVDRARGPAPAGHAARAVRLGDRVGPAAWRGHARGARRRRRRRPDGGTDPRRPRPGRRAGPGRGLRGPRRRPSPARRRHRRADPGGRSRRARGVPVRHARARHGSTGRVGSRGDRARRDLPGEPHPPARGAVRRRPVAAVPAAADRRPGAVRRLSRPRSVPRRGHAASPALGEPGAVPRGRRRRPGRAPTRSRARDRAAARASRTAPLPASCSRAARTRPRT